MVKIEGRGVVGREERERGGDREDSEGRVVGLVDHSESKSWERGGRSGVVGEEGGGLDGEGGGGLGGGVEARRKDGVVLGFEDALSAGCFFLGGGGGGGGGRSAVGGARRKDGRGGSSFGGFVKEEGSGEAERKSRSIWDEGSSSLKRLAFRRGRADDEGLEVTAEGGRGDGTKGDKGGSKDLDGGGGDERDGGGEIEVEDAATVEGVGSRNSSTGVDSEDGDVISSTDVDIGGVEKERGEEDATTTDGGGDAHSARKALFVSTDGGPLSTALDDGGAAHSARNSFLGSVGLKMGSSSRSLTCLGGGGEGRDGRRGERTANDGRRTGEEGESMGRVERIRSSSDCLMVSAFELLEYKGSSKPLVFCRREVGGRVGVDGLGRDGAGGLGGATRWKRNAGATGGEGARRWGGGEAERRAARGCCRALGGRGADGVVDRSTGGSTRTRIVLSFGASLKRDIGGGGSGRGKGDEVRKGNGDLADGIATRRKGGTGGR